MPTATNIRGKIAWAGGMYQEFGERLLSDPLIAKLLDRLKTAIDASHHAMKETGVAYTCMCCDRDEGGSCCGAGLENRYDRVLLLINLLLGANIFTKRRDPRSCLFLGEDGCRLIARHVICVNYVCDKINRAINARALENLREKEGVELETLFVLHERIKNLLEEFGDTSSSTFKASGRRARSNATKASSRG